MGLPSEIPVGRVVEVAEQYGLKWRSLSVDGLADALEEAGQCGCFEVVSAVAYGADYPIRFPCKGKETAMASKPSDRGPCVPYVRDTLGNVIADKAEYQAVKQMLEVFPQLSAYYTLPQIAVKLRTLGFLPTAKGGSCDE